MPLTINELGAPAGEALIAAGETCGASESTSAGLISACLSFTVENLEMRSCR